jgi:hypothetical protein
LLQSCAGRRTFARPAVSLRPSVAVHSFLASACHDLAPPVARGFGSRSGRGLGLRGGALGRSRVGSMGGGRPGSGLVGFGGLLVGSRSGSPRPGGTVGPGSGKGTFGFGGGLPAFLTCRAILCAAPVIRPRPSEPSLDVGRRWVPVRAAECRKPRLCCHSLRKQGHEDWVPPRLGHGTSAVSAGLPIPMARQIAGAVVVTNAPTPLHVGCPRFTGGFW